MISSQPFAQPFTVAGQTCERNCGEVDDAVMDWEGVQESGTIDQTDGLQGRNSHDSIARLECKPGYDLNDHSDLPSMM